MAKSNDKNEGYISLKSDLEKNIIEKFSSDFIQKGAKERIAVDLSKRYGMVMLIESKSKQDYESYLGWRSALSDIYNRDNYRTIFGLMDILAKSIKNEKYVSILGYNLSNAITAMIGYLPEKSK